ncbi:hypothetical protein BK121_16825 [Paenibacillus odorifer]|uniref:EpsG family protein n=1 Tax=Paenibacillus TaxID=44249 RepID=UPI00096DC0D0|nr:EpsG family protein [Paenibacillus odorifer]OMC67807.1 hypothetical protein BK121_16825 [Paenibacillus odorifer]
MIYVVLLIMLGCLSLFRAKVKQKYVVDMTILVFMTIIYGIRHGVGKDYISYELIYRNEYGWYKYEFLYDLLSRIFKYFGSPFWVFNLFLGLIIFSLLYEISRNLRIGYDKIIFFFILSGQLFVAFNLVRQTIAALIIMYSLKYIYEKKIIKYILGVVIASMFHTTALIFLLFYFIKNVNLNFKRVLILTIIGISLYYINIMSLFDEYLILSKYGNLIGSSFDVNAKPGIGTLFYIIIALLLSTKFAKQLSIYFPYAAAYVLCNSLFLFTLSSFIVNRLTMYGQLAVVPAIAYFLTKNRRQDGKTDIINVFIILFYVFLFLLSIFNIYTGDENNLMYQTIFQKTN